jgi:hypothetical protein
MRVRELLKESWLRKIIQQMPGYDEAKAEVFKVLRKSKMFKNQDDATIEKMAHTIVKDEYNKPSVKLSKPKVKTNKDEFKIGEPNEQGLVWDPNEKMYVDPSDLYESFGKILYKLMKQKKHANDISDDAIDLLVAKNKDINMTRDEARKAWQQYLDASSEVLQKQGTKDLKPDADIDIMKDFELWKRLKSKPLKDRDLDEKAPPGREKQVKALKKKFDDPSAPFAIAWAQHKKHGKPKK